MSRSELWNIISYRIVEAKGEKDGFMLISLRTGLFVILILRAPTICVSVGYSLGAGDGV